MLVCIVFIEKPMHFGTVLYLCFLQASASYECEVETLVQGIVHTDSRGDLLQYIFELNEMHLLGHVEFLSVYVIPIIFGSTESPKVIYFLKWNINIYCSVS